MLRQKVFSTRICLLLIAIFLLIGIVFFYSYSTPAFHISRGEDSFAYASSSIAILGADGIGGVSQAFVNSVAAQGLKWTRVCLCLLTTMTLSYYANAGISTIGVLTEDPETSCGSGILLGESTYKAAVQNWVNQFPSIHNWEYGNEVNSACAANSGSGWNIGPSNYFIGLVWAYQVITSTPGHSSDTFQGPTETIWTVDNGASNASCYDTDKLDWFRTFWSQDYQGYTPKSVLTWVDLHVYTDGLQWTDLLSSVPLAGSCSSDTVSQMLTTALNNYYNVEGRSKQIIISETGFQSGNSYSGYNYQATWYRNMMPFYENLGFIKGVFAYQLSDDKSTMTWGLFTSNLQPKPAWSVYQSYLSSSSGSTTTSSSTVLGTSSTADQITSTSSTSTTETSSAATSGSSISKISTSSVGPSQVTFSKSTSVSSTDRETTVASLSNSHSGTASLWSSFSAIIFALSLVKNPPTAYGLATYQLCLIGALIFALIRSRRRRIYNVGNRGPNWLYSIPNTLFRWAGINYFLPHSPWQFGFYENAATRGINVEGSILVHKHRKLSANKQQGKLASGKRGPRGTKAGEVSKNIVKHVASKNGYARKAKKSTTKKTKKEEIQNGS